MPITLLIKKTTTCFSWLDDGCYSASRDWPSRLPSCAGSCPIRPSQSCSAEDGCEKDGCSQIAGVWTHFHRHGGFPGGNGLQRNTTWPGCGSPVLCGLRAVFWAEPRQRVHIPTTSREIRVFLSDRNKERYDGGRISGKPLLVSEQSHSLPSQRPMYSSM